MINRTTRVPVANGGWGDGTLYRSRPKGPKGPESELETFSRLARSKLYQEAIRQGIPIAELPKDILGIYGGTIMAEGPWGSRLDISVPRDMTTRQIRAACEQMKREMGQNNGKKTPNWDK